MKNKQTFTMRWEVVSQMKGKMMKWGTQCCTLRRVTINLWLMTFNVHWKVNTASTFHTSQFITYFKNKVFTRSVWRLLIVDYRWQHLATTLTFLTNYSQDLCILARIVTSNQIWTHHSTLSIKKSKRWLYYK